MTATAGEAKELRDGRYVLLRPLGEGAQGETWEAVDRGPHYQPARPHKHPRDLAADWKKYLQASKGEAAPPRPPAADGGLCAIKAFRIGKAKSWKDVELAEREVKTLAELDHPRLPRYFEHFEEGGTLYLVMEKIEGESLASIRKRRPLGAPEVTKMIADCGEALRYLRERSAPIVHRDIKPGNVLRRPDGSFAIVDFGSVADRLKPAGGSTVVGTFGYMAPEQFQGRASSKSDVFGVGATAIAMLTGREPEDLPHEGLAIDVRRAVPVGTPPGLVRVLQAMLAPDPDARASTIEEALAHLGAPARATPAKETSPPDPVTRQEKRKQRKRARDERRRLERREQHHRTRLARPRRIPLIPSLLAHLGLLIAWIIVWATVGLALPLLLLVLSIVFGLLFGRPLGRAARASVGAAKQAQGGLWRASAWLRGQRKTDPEQIRIAIEEEQRIRVEAGEPGGSGGAAGIEPVDEESERLDDREAAPRRRARHR